MTLNDLFWAPYFRDVMCREVRLLNDVLRVRVLQAFRNIDQEAEEISRAEYERIGSLPGGEHYDMAHAAERAFQTGLVHYEQMMGMRQGIINMFAVFLYHLFEQQLLSFHRRQVLYPVEENDIRYIKIKILKERLSKNSINLEGFGSWGKIEELRIVSNTVKHAEGEAAKRLRDLRPDLFSPRTSDNSATKWRGNVYKPLMGEDIYLTEEDMDKYISAVELFWNELADALP